MDTMSYISDGFLKFIYLKDLHGMALFITYFKFFTPPFLLIPLVSDGTAESTSKDMFYIMCISFIWVSSI